MSIRVSNITKIYGKQRALNDVSFDIPKGEIVGFLGPNGAGKSTMMKILSCFLPASSGDAWVCDYDVTEESYEVRKRVGYLPENNPLYTDMYVAEHLEFSAGVFGISNKSSRIKEMIGITGLGPEKHKKIRALSKGYRQRIGLAQALLHDPDVLILDEPTSGLDPNQLLEIRSLIQKIGREKTVMLSTHIMQEVEAVCNRIIIIDKGYIIADGSTDTIASMVSGSAVILVEFNKEVKESALKEINGLSEVTQVSPTTWQIIACGSKDIRSAIFQYAVSNNLEVLQMKREEKGLEEIFQTLTRK